MSRVPGAAQAEANRAQRRAADPAATVWVSASAGSGKTKVLTDRVLSLMLRGTAPARILCLTFTKAAAAEMANRLASRLAAWAVMQPEGLSAELAALLDETPDADLQARARQLFARVLDAPGGMKIQTIHAFCQSLLGRFPLEAGIAPHAQVLDERGAAEMLEEARIEVLTRAQAPGGDSLANDISDVTAFAAEETLTELIRGLIQGRARLLPFLTGRQGPEALIARIYDALGIAAGETRGAILSDVCGDARFDRTGLQAAAAAMLQGSKKDRAHGAIIAEWLAAPEQRESSFETYLSAFFKEGGRGDRFAKLIFKEALAAAPGSDEVLAREAERLEVLRDRLNALAVGTATAALLRIGMAILRAYEGRKRRRALLDYDDLILRSRRLLERPGIAAWVLYKLDGGLDHVLIDEAQDTNPEQWKVIELLTAEFFTGEGARESLRTVFAVGDAKQSIFSFQGADPTAFVRMQQHFLEKAAAANQRAEKVPLDVSFRSTAPVLAAVDAVFADEVAREGVLFEEAAMAHQAVRGGQAGLVEVWPPVEPFEGPGRAPWELPLAQEADSPPITRLARLVAARIRRWTLDPAGDADPDCKLDSRGRRIRPGDILVLVRRRNAFVDELVRELKTRDVPVAGVDRMILTDQLAVMDLMALGRVMLLPEDDLTLAALLKSPLIGLDEDQLFTLAYGRAGTLWDSLGRQAPQNADFAAARDRLEALMRRADFVPPYEFYAEVLGPLGGREKLLGRLGPEAADPIEEFLSLALAYERDQHPSLEGFLHWLELGAQEIKRDMEHGNDAVRIMTVHGAKGLQAPVVFLPDTLQTPQSRTGLLWLENTEGGAALPLWPIKSDYDGPRAKAARAAQRHDQAQEYRRLLYVAMTRAEDRLYVCGWHHSRGAPEDCWFNLVQRGLAATAELGATEAEFDFTQEITEGWRGTGWRLASPQQEDFLAEASLQAPRAPVRQVPAWARHDAPPEPAPPRPLAPSRPSTAEPAIRSPLAGEGGDGDRRGRAIHRLLQTLPDLPEGERAGAAERYLANPLLGLGAAEQQEIWAETHAVLTDPACAGLFGPGSRAEVPLAGLVPTKRGLEAISGQIDRLVVKDDQVTIIDYKTNRPPPLEVADVPPLYLQQMAAYGALIKQIYPDKSLNFLLLWTDGPRLMQLSDVILSHLDP